MSVDPPQLSLKATFYIPTPEDDPFKLLDRWSDTYVSLPAAVAIPHDESDIIALLAYAKKLSLEVLVTAGKHLASVPITSQTLYIDLKAFTSVSIDEETRTVSVGSGATTGAVLDLLTAAGYYTALPNTNSVGFVGAFLGGGSCSLNSILGFMIDHTVRIKAIIADGEQVSLDANSQGEEAALWHAFHGAGHGLAIITELTMHIYPIADLRMDGNKFWSRTLVFPASALNAATRTFASLQPLQGPIALNLIIQRSPPASPMPNTPIIVLTAAYFGPAADAEKTLGILLSDEVVTAAVMVNTSFLPLSVMNDPTKPQEIRGGLKQSTATLLSNPVKPATIERCFELFLKLTADAPSASRSGVVFYAFDPCVLEANGQSDASQKGFFEPRDTQVIVYHDITFQDPGSTAMVDTYLPVSIAALQEGVLAPIKMFANFPEYPANLNDIYSSEKILEKGRVKAFWDSGNLFFTPGL